MRLLLKKAIFNFFNIPFIQIMFLKIIQKFEFLGYHTSFSQVAEDLIFERYFWGVKKGFFIDVGCNNPIEYNNTFKLYLKGWSGINIDGNQKLINKFDIFRKRDINLCEVISNERAEVIFYLSEDDKVSTLSNEFKNEQEEIGRVYKHQEKFIAKRLEEILDNHLREGQTINLLCIDVEANDFNVLKSNNFDKYRPEFICIEAHNFDLGSVHPNEIVTYLKNIDYKLIDVLSPNLFFKDNRS